MDFKTGLKNRFPVNQYEIHAREGECCKNIYKMLIINHYRNVFCITITNRVDFVRGSFEVIIVEKAQQLNVIIELVPQ